MVLLTLAAGEATAPASDDSTRRGGPVAPTIVMILTDDMPANLLRWIPVVRQTLRTPGTTFDNSFVVNPLCCPARASLLTGNYSHTTGVYTNANGPHGGFESFDDGSTLATWLDEGGFHTGFFGKYLNGYGRGQRYIPPGWDRWTAFAERGGAYYDYTLSVNGHLERHGQLSSDYSTDVLRDHTLSFVSSTPVDTPMFALYAPFAPHGPATPARRYRNALDLPRYRPPNFDEIGVQDKPAYIRQLPRLSRSGVRQLDTQRDHNAESLLAVDQAVGEIVQALDAAGRLETAMVVFTSDNGFAFGEHRWLKKLTPYEESIRVPLVIRYDPLVAAGARDGRLVTNIDLAPTIAEVAGIPAPTTEGESLFPLFADPEHEGRQAFLIEHLRDPDNNLDPPTYCAIRTRRSKYVRYRTGEHELYDLVADPYELHNVAGTPGHRLEQRRLRERLRALCAPRPPRMPRF
ncbi:MAG: sulfatase [Actinomycetota bacterium]